MNFDDVIIAQNNICALYSFETLFRQILQTEFNDYYIEPFVFEQSCCYEIVFSSDKGSRVIVIERDSYDITENYIIRDTKFTFKLSQLISWVLQIDNSIERDFINTIKEMLNESV